LAYGLAGYYGGHAAAHVLAQAGIIGLIVMGVTVAAAWLVIKRRERRATRHGD
jgi:hypothetical protein